MQVAIDIPDIDVPAGWNMKNLTGLVEMLAPTRTDGGVGEAQAIIDAIDVKIAKLSRLRADMTEFKAVLEKRQG